MNPTFKPVKSNKDTVFLTPEFYTMMEDQYVQHAVLDSQQLSEATVVPPEWFIWLHQMTDTPPKEVVRKDFQSLYYVFVFLF